MKTGIVIGRFQVPELTPGHRQILEYCLSNFENCHVILGVPATRGTKMNPLDFESRRQMIEEAYPKKFSISYLKDMNSDSEWSEELDEFISKKYCDESKVFLIGTKDSLLSHYIGKFEKIILEAQSIISYKLPQKQLKDTQWRKGAYSSCQDRYPTVYPTVDCAIFDDLSFQNVWMAKKPHEKMLRFVGGFADPNDDSFEETAIREALEETGMKCGIVSFICSKKIDDWRYRNEKDKIITSLFAMVRYEGTPNASDDIAELHLVQINNLKEENVQPEHRALLHEVKEFSKRQILKLS